MEDSSEEGSKSFRNIATIKEVQNTLASDQILVEYFAGEKNLFIIAITKDDVNIWQKDIPPDFQRNIEVFLNSITGKADKKVFAQKSHEFYQLLIQDVLEWKPESVSRLMIVTDGLLGYIPFDILIQHPAKEDLTYDELKYLIWDYSIGYAPSASLYVLQSKKGAKKSGETICRFCSKI